MTQVAARTNADDLRQEIVDLGLEGYVAELDEQGYTVIPPELATPGGLTGRLLTAILDVAERRNGVRPDLGSGATHAGHAGGIGKLAFAQAADSPIGDTLLSLLGEDQVFEEAVMNPVLLAMATHMCGYGVVLSSLTSMIKGPGVTPLLLHPDSPMPTPMSSYSVVGNCTYALTDYTRENGALAVVPGSHLWCRRPSADEADMTGGQQALAVPVECPAGSLIVWHGNTWHGAFPRTAPGLRVNLIAYLARPFMRSQQDYVGVLSQEALDRNHPRFAILTQQAVSYGYRDPADALERVARAKESLTAYRPAARSLELI